MSMDLYESNVGEIFNHSSFANFTTHVPVDHGSDGSVQPPALPYEIPDCPPGSLLQDLFYIPDYLVHTFFYTSTDKFIITYIYSIIFAVGLLSNAAFLFTVARIRQMRTMPNFYLVNLACADMILILSKGVNSFYRYIWSSDINRAVPYESPAACGLIYSMAYLGYYASVCLVTLISIERYMAICHPFKHRRINGKGYTIKVVCSAWFIALLFTGLSSPNFSSHYKFCVIWPAKWQSRLPTVINICTAYHDSFFYVVAFAQAIPFSIAIVVNTLLYSLIIRQLSMRDVAKGEEKGEQQKQADQVRNAVTRMLIITGVIFFLCLAPFQFYNAYLLASRFANYKQFFDPAKMQIVAYISRILDLINSSVNPMIYSATNARYRHAFLAAFGCDLDSKKKRDAVSAATKSTSGI